MYQITPRLYFFGGSTIITIINIVISIFNIKWNNMYLYIGIIYVFIQSICTFAVSEILLKTLLVIFHKPEKIKSAKTIEDSSFIINYNLKAADTNSIDECFQNMYNAFIGNITKNSIAVIVSVTVNSDLQKYEESLLKTFRQKIYYHLYKNQQKYKLKNNQIFICKQISENFILIRRKSNILKKCGQYQDLITFTLGYNNSYTYTCKELYQNKVRNRDAFFEYNIDLDKIFNKKYDYTMILDSDTQVPNHCNNYCSNLSSSKKCYYKFSANSNGESKLCYISTKNRVL